MEPNKLEKDFKDKLEQRTIQPSEMAWDRLDAMLSVAENKKPKSDRRWMYMAASFLVFLLAGVLLLNQEKENTGPDNNINGIVTTKEQPNTENTIAPTINNQEVANNDSTPVVQDNKQGEAKHSVTNNKTQITEIAPQEILAANDKKDPAIVPVNNAEQLLAIAVKQDTPRKKSSVKVDPNALLSSVEEELDNNFKDRVLIGTVENFKAVKTAVTNRNYQ